MNPRVLTSMSLAMVGLLQRLAQEPVALDEVHGPLLKGLMTRGLATHHNDRAFLTWAGHKVLNHLEGDNEHGIPTSSPHHPHLTVNDPVNDGSS